MTCIACVRRSTLALLLVALTACTTDSERFISSAQSHLAAGREREAAIELRNAVAAEPDHPLGNFLLGKLLAKVGSLVDAEIILRQSLKAGYPPAEVVPVLGGVLLEAEKFSALLSLLNSIDGAGSGISPARLALLKGRAYTGLGQLLEARTQLALALPELPDDSRIAMAELAMASGDWAGAERELHSVTASAPKNAEAWIASGLLMRRLGRDDAAAGAFAKAIEAAPDDPVALLSQAIVYLTRDDLQAAKPLLEKAGKIAPLKPMLEFANGLLALKEGRGEDARAALQRLLDAVPTYRPALLLAGALNFSNERYDLAENSYAAYLRFDPNNVFARKMLGATLIAKGRPDSALEVMAPVLANARDVEILVIAGRANLALGRVSLALRSLEQAIKIDPDNADARLNMAHVDLVAGRRSAAATQFEAAIKLRPEDSRANRGYCMMLLADGRIERAGQVAQVFLGVAPRSPDAHTLAGAVDLARRNDAAARTHFERALAINPTFIAAAEALADIEERAGVTGALKKRMDAVIAADPKNLDALLIRARLELESGGGEQSAARMRDLLTQHPRSLRALLLLAESQLKSGQVAEAIATARRASEENPWDTTSLFLLSDAQLVSGDTAGAIVTLDKASALAPTRMEPQLRLVRAHVQSGDLRTAISRLNVILRKDRMNVTARLMLGQVYIASKRIDDAFSQAKELQKVAPTHFAGHRLEGEAALAAGLLERAVQSFVRADALSPSGETKMMLHRARTMAAGKIAPIDDLQGWLKRNPADRQVRLYLADSLLVAKHFADAAEHYRVLHKESENDPHVLNNLAWAELHLGREAGIETALDLAQRAAKLRPEDARVLDTLGVALTRAKREADAVQVLLRAQSKDPMDYEVRLHLSEALWKVGDGARARKELLELAGRGEVPRAIRASAAELLSKIQGSVR